MRRRILASILAITAVVLTAAGVQAYATYARWTANTATFVVNPANADVSGSAAVAALQAAMNVWNTEGNSAFQFQYGGTASDTSTSYDNRNVVIFRNTTSGGAIASTYSWWNSSNQLLDSDIVFWDGGFAFFTGDSGCGVVSNAAYIEDVATHEFGHALGLNHSDYTDATMYPSYSYCSQAFRTLSPDDVAAVRSLYPGSSSPAPTPSNSAPSVSINSPANGAVFAEGTTVSFSGSASDPQDGNLTSSIQWTDNGTALGVGGSISPVLTVGSHTIVASVTDSGSLQGSRTITVTLASTTSGGDGSTTTKPAPATKGRKGRR